MLNVNVCTLELVCLWIPVFAVRAAWLQIQADLSNLSKYLSNTWLYNLLFTVVSRCFKFGFFILLSKFPSYLAPSNGLNSNVSLVSGATVDWSIVLEKGREIGTKVCCVHVEKLNVCAIGCSFWEKKLPVSNDTTVQRVPAELEMLIFIMFVCAGDGIRM